MFHDIERLRRIAPDGGLQVVFAGKAHPRDEAGKEVIQRIFQIGRALAHGVAVVYLPNYDMALADCWPRESTCG